MFGLNIRRYILLDSPPAAGLDTPLSKHVDLMFEEYEDGRQMPDSSRVKRAQPATVEARRPDREH